jgi:integrase
MPLKLKRRPNTPNWIMRGTVRGQSIEETTGTSDYQAAEAIRIQREKEILDRSVYGTKITTTFAEAALDYLKFGGREGDGGEVRFLKPIIDHFSITLLHKIGQDEIDRAAKALYPKAGPATRNRQAYTPIAAILKHAARKGWCATPVLRRPSQPKGKLRWLKPDEADRLIDACAPHLRPIVTFLIYTGARAGEAVWLDWRNVDLAKRQVTFPQTKNGMPRSVPLHPRVLEALRGNNHRSGPVFRTHKGQPYSAPSKDNDADTSAGSRINGAFFTACKRAGLSYSPSLGRISG